MSLVDSGKLIIKKGIKNVVAVLLKAKMDEKKVVAWKMLKNEKIIAGIKLRKINKTRNEFTISFSEYDPLIAGQIVKGQEFLNFFIPSDSILVQAKIKDLISVNEILLAIPDEYNQVERRKHMRLHIFDSELARVIFRKNFNYQSKVKGLLFERSCLDIGPGGLSILVNKSELKYFSIRNEIRNAEFSLAGVTLGHFTLRVVNMIEVGPTEENKLIYKGWKICLNFDRLPPTEEERIRLFIFKYLKINSPKYN